MKDKVFLLFILLLVLVVGAPIPVAAQGATQADDWQYEVTLYLWGIWVSGGTTFGTDVDFDFNDVFDSTQFAFMAAGEARKGKWALAADVMFLDTDENRQIRPNLVANTELRTWVVTPTVRYNLMDTGNGRLDVLLGTRYLNMEADLRLRLLELPEVHGEESNKNWDGIIGLKGTADVSENWHLFGHVDLGAGDSDSTWQFVAGFGYKFGWGHVNLAYRYLEWDFDDTRFVEDLDINGPVLGFKFLF